MRSASIAALLGIAFALGCSCSHESHLPAPNAPEAPAFADKSKPAPSRPSPTGPQEAKPAQKPPQPSPSLKDQPPLSKFPASHEPPIHGLPLEFKFSALKVPDGLAEPSPPRVAKDDKKAKP